jgi:hypothetical protein
MSQFGGEKVCPPEAEDVLRSVTATLDVIHIAVQDVHANWILYRGLFEDLKNRELLANAMGPMWSTLRTALADSVVLSIAKLADPADSGIGIDNASLKRLARDCKPFISPNAAPELISRMADFAASTELLVQHRMKRIAHHDLNVSIDPSLALPNFGISDVTLALENIKAIINLINQSLGRSLVAYDKPIIGDPARGLLRQIEQAKAVRELSLLTWSGELDCDAIKGRVREIAR